MSRRRRITSRGQRCYYDSEAQGAPGIAKKDPGSIFVEMTFGLGLTKYVSGRLSIYGKYFHICMTRLHYNGEGQGLSGVLVHSNSM